MQRKYFWHVLALAIAASLFVGCNRSPTATSGQSRQMLQRRTDQAEGLLSAAIAQLQDLPSYVDTELRPPVVVLDARHSSDGQDVMAVCTTHPDVPDGLINYIDVRTANSRFRSLGVRPGDILKYYVMLHQDSFETGIAQQVAMELRVAQVLHDNALLVEGGLNMPVLEAAKIEVWRYADDRLQEINSQLRRYVTRRGPPISWEPTPDAKILSQIVVRLNQWLRQTEPKTDWQVDPLLATLDKSLAGDRRLEPYISAEALAEPYFRPHDGRLLHEAVWLRDISRWAQGDRFQVVERAASLFDWTVRNVQLEADRSTGSAPRRPWQVLAYGRGTAEERAWVFALLCRQQGLDVVMLSVPPQGDQAAETDAAQFWLAALFNGDQLYLFDPQLGLPIAGPDGQGVATLADARADDGLLRQLDLEGSPYPITAEQIRQVTIEVVADPVDLTRRAEQLESKLAGDDRIVLTSRASDVAELVQSVEGVADVRIWGVPFRTLRDQLALATVRRLEQARFAEALAFEPFAMRPKLWKARALHFQGRRQARSVREGRSAAAEEMVDDHRQAGQLYLDPDVRPPDRRIDRSESEDQQRVERTAKLAATYWVGLLSFDDGKYEVAANWLERPELMAAGSPWADGVRYNLARTYEAQEKLDEAIALYEADRSPQQHGNRLRAGRLKVQADQIADAQAADSSAE